ncbi:MAG: metalloregulator ArsR/SmtB family transcription factor [Anaerolineales bacterium]|nr:metalloregulator ArsR/SmtB family transcription factor [Anaerolineales bacterium]
MTDPITHGWQVGRSIVLELQFVLFWGILSEQRRFSSAAVQRLIADIPAAWIKELTTLLGAESTNELPLDYMAWIAQTLFEDDYSAGTLPIRELTLAQGVELLAERLPAGERSVAGSLAERWQENGSHLIRSALRRAAYDATAPDWLDRRLRLGFRQMIPLLRNGEHHSRFWHWLDRFYYDRYREWRVSQTENMAAQEQQGIAALGGRSGSGVPPLDWLPPINALRHRANLAATVATGEWSLVFWAQPLELADSVTILPHQLVVAFGDPSESLARFVAFSENVAQRLKALSDPTRLFILRLIRRFSMDNTEMADVLEIARPTVSVHAKVLREAGLIHTKQIGRQAQHEIDAAAIRKLVDDLLVLLDLPEGE